MGGGAMHIDVPVIHCKTSFFALPSLSSPTTPSSLNFPVSANNSTGASRCHCPNETESAQGRKEKRATRSFSFEDVFGVVPSQSEVQSAIVALQTFVQGIPPSGSEFNQLLQMSDSDNDITESISHAYRRAKDAFRLMQTDPVTKRLVVSLSSDKAVWDALINNEMMLQLRKSCFYPENCRIQSCNEKPDVVACMLSWIMNIAKAKVTELLEKFQLLMNEIFQSHERGKHAEENAGGVDDMVRSSLLLSIVILLIVVVARFHQA